MSSLPPEWGLPQPTPPVPTPPRRGRPAWQVVLIVLVPVVALLLVLGAVMGDDDTSDVDPQDVAACNTFRSAAADYRDGVLTTGELRARFQDVNDDARGATGPVAKAARDMLAASTSGPERLADAITAMDAACDEVG